MIKHPNVMETKRTTISVEIDSRFLDNQHYYNMHGGNDWRTDLGNSIWEFKQKYHVISISETALNPPSFTQKPQVCVFVTYRDYTPDELLTSQILYQIENIL